jgi:tetratricopeptide (TPR) repeat protein
MRLYLQLAAVALGLAASNPPGVLRAANPAPATSSNPAAARELTDRAIAAQTAGQHVEALALLDEALALLDHPKIRYFRAKSLLALGRRAEALAAFRTLAGVSEVEKYRVEIETFIRAIEGDAQVAELATALDREREAREAAEKAARVAADAARREAEAREEALAVKVLQSRRTGLLPPPESRLRLGPVSARMVPTEPEFTGPNLALQQAADSATITGHLDAFEDYGLARIVASVLGGFAVAGLGTGAGLYLGPGGGPDGGGDGSSARDAGLTVGIVGAVLAMASLAVLPSEPPLGLAKDPLDKAAR